MQREDIRVVFMGTPEFAQESLKELYEEETKNWPKLTPDKNVKIKGTEIPENENDDFYTL